MSFQTFVTEQLAAINSTLNAIGNNAKRIFELPSQNNLDPASLIHVSRGGVSESLSVQKIIDAVSSGTYNQLISIGEIDLTGNELTIPPNAQWKIDEVYYSNIAEIEITVPYCATGLERKDILVANTLNDIILVQGPETTGITIRPNIPIDTVFVTDLDVTDSTIDITPPVIPANFIEKAEYAELIIPGGDAYVQFSLPYYSSLRFVGETTFLAGVYIFPEYKAYSGKKLTIKNFQTTDILLKHLEDDPLCNINFYFPAEVDYILKPGEIIELSLSLSSNCFELIGNNTDLSNYYNKTEIDTKLSSVLVYKGSVANYAALPSTGMEIGWVYNLSDTGHNYAWNGTVWDDLGPAVDISGKQDVLVSGTNIKTVNGNSLLGSGNVITPDMDTTTAQTVSGIKTFLAGMLGLRNTANTFTSFFASAVTASRTWTWPDKNGTVAMTSDIVAQLSGTINKLVKFGTTTTGANSRIEDTGTYLGIGNTKSPLKDITLGYQSDKVIGIEQSDSSTVGRDLSIEAGRTINFSDISTFTALGQTARNYTGIFPSSYSGNIYVTVYTGDIYKQTSGSGNFVALGGSTRNWSGICESPNGDVYACVGGGMSNNNSTGDIYKQTGGVGAFVALGQTTRSWAGMCAAPNGDIYASVGGGFAGGVSGDIYMQTGGVGAFVALSQASRVWQGMCAASNGDIFAVVRNGDIYKQTGGTGNFVGLGQTSRIWSGITKLTNGDFVAVTGYGGNTGDIYKQTGGVGAFVATGASTRTYNGVGTNNGIDVYAIVFGGDIYKQTNQSLGTADLAGGTLKLKSGTGKGVGSSKVEIITGQKIVSGTDMQAETLRAYYDEDGNYKRIGTPIYADNVAALAGGLTAGMEYRTATGIKMEVY